MLLQASCCSREYPELRNGSAMMRCEIAAYSISDPSVYVGSVGV